MAQIKQETRVFQARVFQQRVFQEVAGCFKVKQTMQSKCTTYISKKKVTAVTANLSGCPGRFLEVQEGLRVTQP